MNNISTGGHWQPSEAKHHINYLERLAAYFVLKFFIKDVKGKHIKIMIDNTTAVSVINNMGTCHSYPCNSIIGCKIWTPCEENRIWLTAAHIPGKENVTADYESRYSNLDTEWMLNPKYQSQVLEGIAFTPVIHLFASRINKQFDQYVSYIDAFTISWAETKFYCFPPFSCMLTLTVVRKIVRNKARGVLVVPQWPTVMVSHAFSNIGTTTSCPSTSAESVTNAIQAMAEAPATQEAKNSYLSCIRGKLQVRGFSADTIYIILSSRGYPNSVQISCQEML